MKLARRFAATLLVGMFVNASSSARAQPVPVSPLFSAYQDLCLRNLGDQEKILVQAQAAGWTTPPPSDLLPLGALSMNDSRQLERVTAAGRQRLAIGHAVDPAEVGGGADLWRVCVVSAEPADLAAAAALQRWAGVAPARSSDAAQGSLLFVMSGAAGARTSADALAPAELQARIKARDLVAAGVKTLGPVTLLLYATPQP